MFRFQFKRLDLPFGRSVRTAHGNWNSRRGVLIRLENEKGGVGFGEMADVPGFTKNWADSWLQTAKGLGEHVDAETLRRAFPEGPAAWAVDEALRRVRGAEAKPFRTYLPVAGLLRAGRECLDGIPLLEERGFRVFKWKVGVLDDRDEQAILDDLLAALPDGSKLRLDANGAWDRRRAERWLAFAAERPVEFVEQPIAPDTRGAVDLLHGLAEDYPVPIALDESLANGGDVLRWLEEGWPGVFVLKASLMGPAGRYLGPLAKARAKVVFSSSLETRIGCEAALRIAFEFEGESLALGFGVWPLYPNPDYDGPHLAPFVRWEELATLKPEVVWNAVS